MSLLLSSELFLIFRNLLITLTVIALIIAPFLFVKYSDRKHAKYQADIHNLPRNTMILLSIWPPKWISRFHRIKYVGKSFGYAIALYTIGIVLALIKEYLKTGHWELQNYLVSTLPILAIILVFCFIDSIKSGLFKPLHAGIAYIGDPTSLTTEYKLSFIMIQN